MPGFERILVAIDRIAEDNGVSVGEGDDAAAVAVVIATQVEGTLHAAFPLEFVNVHTEPSGAHGQGWP